MINFDTFLLFSCSLSGRLMNKLLSLRQLDGEIVRGEQVKEFKGQNELPGASDPAPLGISQNTLI